ncbi:Clp protease N-terminal domain-containing protein [Gordonia sp. NPDC062954]|uniref:Clp protease N-terminal domain-containing protein n=1 Tax=Gordonia sp. NPDC062954 TaxID=3364003 RepID=UPI0037C6B721
MRVLILLMLSFGAVALVSYLRSPDYRLRRWSRKGGIQHYAAYAHAEVAGVRIRSVDYGLEGKARNLARMHVVGAPVVLAAVALLLYFTHAPVWLATIIVSLLLLPQLTPIDTISQTARGLRSRNRRQRSSAVRGAVYAGIGVSAVVVGTMSIWFAIASERQGESWSAWGVFTVFGISVLGVAEVATLMGKRKISSSQSARFGRDAATDDTLFLRSFDDDSMRLRAIDPHVGFFSVFSGMTARFEELMAAMLSGSTSLIAIGKPSESLPELGAVRTYVADDEWQEAVEVTAQRVGSIVLVAGVTDGLEWELTHLRMWGCGHKVTVMLPPVDQSQAWNRLHRVLRQLGIDFDTVERDDNTGAWLGVLLRTVTALGIDDDGRPVFYVSHRRDWLSYGGTLVFSQNIVRGTAEPPRFGEIAEARGLELRPGAEMAQVSPAVSTDTLDDRLEASAKRAIAEARVLAGTQHDKSISAEHLLLGLTAEKSSQASRLLVSLGLDVEEVRGRVLSMVSRRND